MNFLITGAFGKNNIDYDFFAQKEANVFYMQNEEEELLIDVSTIDVVICNALFLYHDIKKFKNLKYIQLTSSGMDRIPIDYCKKNNIIIKNARGVYSIPMAEFAVFSVLSVLKDSKYFIMNQKSKIWKKNRDIQELNDMTVCIVGCGSVGTECAKRFLGFDCHIIGVDICTTKNEWFENIYGIEEINKAIFNADIVILTLPLTDSTYHLINEERIKKFKKGSIIVNIARGGILDSQALYNNRNHFKAIILDVFEQEPLDVSSNLWDCDNIHIFPHNSFVGNNNYERLRKVIYSNIEQYCITGE